ncbi:hypothetical protein PtB15_6B850 [Puccinia triticina]|nr:hypothetical protein PtB15_6B850 [Puccinia triticina]
MVIFLIMLGGQILIVEVGGAAFQVTSIGARDWLISVIIGLLSLPLAVLIKLLPTEPIGKLVYGWGWLRDPSKLELEIVDLGKEYDDDDRNDGDQSQPSKWNPAIDRVRDNLAIFSQIRGGRMIKVFQFCETLEKVLVTRERDPHWGINDDGSDLGCDVDWRRMAAPAEEARGRLAGRPGLQQPHGLHHASVVRPSRGPSGHRCPRPGVRQDGR